MLHHSNWSLIRSVRYSAFGCSIDATSCPGMCRSTFTMVSGVASGTNLTIFDRSDWDKFKTGDVVEVFWNTSSDGTGVCTSVNVNGKNCSSCEICGSIIGGTSVSLSQFQLTPDCQNLERGRKASCEEFL